MSSVSERSRFDPHIGMTDASTHTNDNSVKNNDEKDKNDKKKKLKFHSGGSKSSILPKIFGSKWRKGSDEEIFGTNEVVLDLEKRIISRRRAAFMEASPYMTKSFSERHGTSLRVSNFDGRMSPAAEVQECRIFVATWNVGGKSPHNGLNLEDFLQSEGSSDIYVLGFQEIVPLNAGNVLVSEDNEPAAKWLTIINQALNRPLEESSNYCSYESNRGSTHHNNGNSKDSKHQGSFFSQKTSLKVLRRNLRGDSDHLKSCNCTNSFQERRRLTEIDNLLQRTGTTSIQLPHKNSNEDLFSASDGLLSSPTYANYRLVASKQMVGIFLSVWARKELVQHIGHLRLTCVGRGIMGYLGNKGCIAISMSLHETSFCFVCSHLASGEKEGDELKRNSDVSEILKSTQFPRICKNGRIPENILEHDRVIWLGDLNYRIALSYEETRILLEDNDWDTLLEKDQLNIEREAGRVFAGFNEGRIMFAPTYKYSHNSDSYAGETIKSKKKRRTPAWCDRILWYGKGMEQLSYIRGESRFSDHRPVCAAFIAEAKSRDSTRIRKGLSAVGTTRMDYDECIPQRHSFYEF
ncbi:type I inositol polyphosphate 5-phosphatase 5-like [Macadamia integrifolia]|uniref:type I inositol polyphosphate 5-phosphatase 5-like n=1 Tax=Macadamia integrifolia TaxID=60698 RepID=UPI001C4FB2F6|nr:type I inositol polyphosphate 5-phosphatase 5-like [Macadamia integrifolia]XP_042495302.1 type I inositol polyphosphate 5-phosphatase 5-like [Macadamia integrifolia]